MARYEAMLLLVTAATAMAFGCDDAHQHVTCAQLVPSTDNCSAFENARLCPRTCGCIACIDSEPNCPVAADLETLTTDFDRHMKCLETAPGELLPNYMNCPVSCPNGCIPPDVPTSAPTSLTGSGTPATQSSPDPYEYGYADPGIIPGDPTGGGDPGEPGEDDDLPPLPPANNGTGTDDCQTNLFFFNAQLCAGTFNVLSDPFCAFELLDARIANCQDEDLDFPIISGAQSDYFYADIPKNVTSLDYFWSRLQNNPSYINFNLGRSNDRGTVNAWNTSGITSMVEAFALANYNLDMTAWDVSSVTDMALAFDCGLFNCSYDYNLQGWDVSSVTNFTDMFANNRLIHTNIGLWDLSNGGDTVGRILGSGQERACYNYDLGIETYCTLYGQLYATNSTQHMPDVSWRPENVFNATDIECQLTFSSGADCCSEAYCSGGACVWCTLAPTLTPTQSPTSDIPLPNTPSTVSPSTDTTAASFESSSGSDNSDSNAAAIGGGVAAAVVVVGGGVYGIGIAAGWWEAPNIFSSAGGGFSEQLL